MRAAVKYILSGVFAGGIILSGVVLAGEAAEAKFVDPDALLIEAQKILANQPAPDVLPVAESEYDGYWWNNQDRKAKQNYIKQLIELFGVENKKLKINQVIEKMNVIYNPKDDPADIKIDKSVEKIFYEVIR